MIGEKISIDISGAASAYEITIRNGSLADCGAWAKKCLQGKASKAAIVSNAKVFGIYGEAVTKSLKAAGFEVFVHLIGDGEKHKNFRTLQGTLNAFSENRLSRTDAVIALGGGVVGDLAGFAASVYLRGVTFLQIPTTLLSMIDSSVGGKTAVNTAFGKNLIGTFYQPQGVLIDLATLQTLPKRELTAGFCEAIKQGAISGRELFDQTADLLQKYPVKQINKAFEDQTFIAGFEKLLAAQVSFKAKIVRGDEKEDPAKTDASSRKILNFGHTLAHALEKVTGYKYLKHGEAVGYGIIFAAELSKKLELLPQDEVNLLNDVVHQAGKLPPVNHIDQDLVYKSFQFDKKVVENSLQWILLKGIGKPVIVSHIEIPEEAVISSIKKIISN